MSETTQTAPRARRRAARLSSDTGAPVNAPDLLRIAKAVYELREEQHFTQAGAAVAAGWDSAQAWQRYEAATPPKSRKLAVALREPELQAMLMSAINLTRQALLDRIERLRWQEEGGPPPRAYHGVQEDGRPFEVSVDGRNRLAESPSPADDLAGTPGIRDLSWMFNGGVRWMVVGGELMSGYAEAGTLIAYDTTLKPRRGDGCVVELKTGERFVREYLRTDQRKYHFAQRQPKAEMSWDIEAVKGVYKIKARID